MLVRECNECDKISIIRISGANCNIKISIAMRFPFYAFLSYAAVRSSARVVCAVCWTKLHDETLHNLEEIGGPCSMNALKRE